MRFILFLSLLPTAFIVAQSNYLQNPDIVWATRIEQDWVIDNPSLENEWEDGITTLKLLRPKEYRWEWDSPFLADLVLDAAKNGDFPVFEDPECRIPMKIRKGEKLIYQGIEGKILPVITETDMAIYVTDTVITFDPVTYDEKITVVTNEPDASQIYAWRLRQVLTYNAKKAIWNTTIEAIAPLLKESIPDADSFGLRPLFWFRPDDEQKNLRSKNIIWAKRIISKQPPTMLSFAAPHVLKASEGYQNPLVHQIRVLGTDMKKPFYGPGNEHPLSREERLSMLSRSDTVVIFDPETYEEKVTVVSRNIDPASITQLRLMQTWYWDEKKHRLSIYLDAVAPMVDVKDSDGQVRFQQPLYYRRR